MLEYPILFGKAIVLAQLYYPILIEREEESWLHMNQNHEKTQLIVS